MHCLATTHLSVLLILPISIKIILFYQKALCPCGLCLIKQKKQPDDCFDHKTLYFFGALNFRVGVGTP